MQTTRATVNATTPMSTPLLALLPALAATLLLTSCASRPSAIAPSNVSATEYQGMSCNQTTSLLAEKRAALQTAEAQQNRAATGDALGVFLLFVPVSSVFGGDNEGMVAQYKGEVLALERAVGINCKQ